MANDDKYIVTRSNYTVKTKHQQVGTDSSIYERDYMAIGGVGAFENTSLPYNESNFKMVSANNQGRSRLHKYGDWIEVDGETVLSLDLLPSGTSTESKIYLKPNYGSLLDFVYYGSCVEALNIAVKNIINDFPAEIYISDTAYNYVNKNGDIVPLSAGNTALVVTENPFNIDVSTPLTSNISGISNPLRYLSLSFDKYELIDKYDNVVVSDLKWEVKSNKPKCFETGDLISEITLSNHLKLYEFKVNDSIVLMGSKALSGYRIRPKAEYVEAFYNSLTDIAKALVNRNSDPIYTAVLDYVFETEDGFKTYKKNYTWPSLRGWNLDVSSPSYSSYISELVTLGTFYDEYMSDNMWRMIVHDSIKTMDHTFSNPSKNEDSSDYILGTTKFRDLLNVYAAFFDKLKRYIDNINYVNNITYNEYNNLPDYFLSDALELSGWDITSSTSALNQTTTVDNLYGGDNSPYSAADAHTTFLRNLKLNSSAILSHKGTIEGIKMVLALFGLQEAADYAIWESIYAAQSNFSSVPYKNELTVQKINKLKKSYVEETYTDEESLQGLPVKMVYYTKADGTVYKYIIPWFDSVQEIDGNPYFQMYGGWMRTDENTDEDTNTEYDETIKYLSAVRNVSDLLDIPYGNLTNGDIFYVYDLSDYEQCFGEKLTEDISNYFIIKDREKCTIFGNGGWDNIEDTDYRVVHLKNIVDEYRGNNPHCGFGKYDSGFAYLDLITYLFRYSIENDNFLDDAYKCNSGDFISGVNRQYFSLYKVQCTRKTQYFHDPLPDVPLKELASTNGIYNASEMEEVEIDIDLQNRLYDYETNTENIATEAAANSIVNIKNIELQFYLKASYLSEEERYLDYLKNNILPYVKQMLPSTAIVRVRIFAQERATLKDEE